MLERVPRRSCKALLKATAYLVFLVLVFEGGARLIVSVDPIRKRIQGSDDASHRLRFTRPRTTSGLYRTFDKPHPIRGWALRPNLHDVPAFGETRLSSNSRGVRGAREYSLGAPRDALRILVFGDSFTFGEDVGDDDTFCARLQKRIPEAEVVNLGVHGYGHDQMLLYLQEVGRDYAPDLVLLGFVSVDMERNRLGFRDFAKPRFELVGDHLVLTGTPVPTPSEVLAGEVFRSKFADLFTMLFARLRERSGREDLDRQQLTLALLDDFRRTVLDLGAQPFFVFLPVGRELSEFDAPSAGESFFSSYCYDYGVPHVVLRDAFRRAQAGGLQIRIQTHWDRAEHEVAAEEIYDALEQQGLLHRAPPSGGS